MQKAKNNNYLVELGLRLKEVRKSKLLTQKAFAEIGKVSVQSQKLYEAGTRPPNSEYLYNLSTYGLDACYIFSGLRHQTNNSEDNFDRKILVEILEIIEKYSAERDKPMSTEVKIDLASLFYVPFSEIGKVDHELINGYLSHTK